MTTAIPDPHQIRQYLLGRLDDKEELENTLSEGILFQSDMSEMADLIEDEIIEQYLDGTLDSADRNDVEKYFLRPAERRERLQFARLLRDRLRTSQPGVVTLSQDVSPLPSMVVQQAGSPFAPSVHRHSFFRTYGQVTVLVLLFIVSVTYISSLQKRQGRLEAALVQEGSRAAILEKQSLLLQSRTLPLYLVPDAARALGGPIPYVEIKPSAELVVVDLALRDVVSGRDYDVVLTKKGAKEPTWSAKLPPIISPSGGARLVFDLPVQGVESGTYRLVVSSTLPGPSYREHYEFEARVTR
jgi:hypothetical protein